MVVAHAGDHAASHGRSPHPARARLDHAPLGGRAAPAGRRRSNVHHAPPGRPGLHRAIASTLSVAAAMPPRMPSSRPVTSTRASPGATLEQRPTGPGPSMGPDHHTRGRPNCWPRSTTLPQRCEPQPRVARGRAISWPRQWKHPQASPSWNTEGRRRRPLDPTPPCAATTVRPTARPRRAHRTWAARSAPPTAARCSSPSFLMRNYDHGAPIATLLTHVACGAIVGGFASIAG